MSTGRNRLTFQCTYYLPTSDVFYFSRNTQSSFGGWQTFLDFTTLLFPFNVYCSEKSLYFLHYLFDFHTYSLQEDEKIK